MSHPDWAILNCSRGAASPAVGPARRSAHNSILARRHHQRTGVGRSTSNPTASCRERPSWLWSGFVTTLRDRPNTALVVVDVQNGVVSGNYQRDKVVTNIDSLVERARREGVPVVWIQDFAEDRPKDSEAWRIVPELTPSDAEPHVDKEYGDSFEDTTLESVLSGLNVGRLFVVGAQTDACVRSTLHGAFVRGYDTVLVSDAHTTEDQTAWGAPPPDEVIAHTNLYWRYQAAPGRTAAVVETEMVDFRESPGDDATQA